MKQYKIPFFRTIILLIIGIPISWLVVQFLLSLAAHRVGIQLPSMGDSNGQLATIGSIMGAIFAVGGLVVALVAVLTQLQLEDRVNSEIKTAQESLINKFQSELIVDFKKQILNQVEGMLDFFQAANMGDWKQAERLTRAALDKYPELIGARRFLGLYMADDIQKYFFNKFLLGIPPNMCIILGKTIVL